VPPGSGLVTASAIHKNAELKYTPGTRSDSEFAYIDGHGHCGKGQNSDPLLRR
jgi:hypothetical protein